MKRFSLQRFALRGTALAFFLISHITYGQTFDLKFEKTSSDGSTLAVKVLMQLSSAGDLGSSNLVFTYDGGELSSPSLATAHNFSGGNYQTMTLTSPATNTVSLNIELTTDNAGTAVSNSSFTEVATINFTLTDGVGTADLQWQESSTQKTVIYLEDNSTRIISNTLNNNDLTISNEVPTATGLITTLAVTEDIVTDVDLSSSTISDAEDDDVTVTLTANNGTLASTDGNGTTGSVTIASSGTAAMTLTGKVGDINTYLNTSTKVNYTPVADANGNGAASITVQAKDAGTIQLLSTITVNITAANDAPVLNAASSPALTAIDEDSGDDDGSGADGDDDGISNTNNSGTAVASIVVDGSITEPADGGAVEAIAVTNVDNTNGVWQYTTDNGTNWNNFSGTTGSAADISTSSRLLDGTNANHKIRFVPNADYNGSATFTFRAWDKSTGVAGSTANTTTNGGTTAFSSTSDNASVTINSVNDVPTATGLITTLAGTEDVVTDVNLSASTFSDAEDDNVTVTLTANNGTLASTDGNGTTGSVTIASSGTAAMTLTGKVGDINTYLNTSTKVNYTPVADANGNGAASITVQAKDAGTIQLLSTITVNITAANDASIVTATGGTTTFNEGGGAVTVDGALNVTDIDNNTLSTGTVSISNNYQSSEDVLAFTNDGSTMGNIAVQSNTGGVLTLVSAGATATVAQWQIALRAVTYNNSSSTPNTANRTITFAVNDGTDASNNSTQTLSITADSTAPVFEASTPSSASITQTGFTLGTDIDEAGTIYYVVVLDDATAPSSANVKAGEASGGGAVVTSGNASVSSGGFSNDFTVTGLSAGTTYDVYVVAEDDDGTPNLQTNPSTIEVLTSAPSSLQVAATVILEGAWNGSTAMNTVLEDNDLIATSAPYDGINSHAGSEFVANVAAVPDGAVDWVLVELREAASAATAFNATRKGSAAGFLMSDGTIKATDGTSNLTINLSGNSGTDYFVVIYHRNHLPIMSASAVVGSSGTLTIDFTSSSANTYQTTTALVSIGGGKFGLPAGDTDRDGGIDSDDLATWRTNNGTAFVYTGSGIADFNLDGAINAVDKNGFHRKNTSKTRQVPTTND